MAFILSFLVPWTVFRVESDTLASPQPPPPALPCTEVDLEVEPGTAASAASDAEAGLLHTPSTIWVMWMFWTSRP